MGNKPRVRTWGSIAEAAGFDVVSVAVPQSTLPVPDPRVLWQLLRADAVLESTVRSTSAVRRMVAEADADIVVFVTARVFDAEVARTARHVVLDLVDELSANYALRATRDATPGRQLAFRALYLPMRRFERKPRSFLTTAAGHRDAERLGAQWVPNLIAGDAPQCEPAETARDLIFVGSLRYEPNIEALRRFLSVWRRLSERRPGTTMLIAGASPSAATAQWLSSVPGWEVLADFTSLDEVLRLGRVSVVPVESATGFSNKVLEAAERGVPQVISERVRAGLGPEFPGRFARTDAEWVSAIEEMLESPAAAGAIAERVRRYVNERYAPSGYADLLAGVIASTS